MRKRNNSVMTRYSDEELRLLKELVKKYGMTLQAYINKTSLNVKIPTSEEVVMLKDMNKTLADIDRQLKGMATNINQMARVANGQGFLPAARKLEEVYAEIKALKEEVYGLWQSTRLLIGGQIHTPQ